MYPHLRTAAEAQVRARCSAGVLTQLERGRGLLRDVVELPKRPGRLRNIAQFVQVKVERVVYWQPISS